MIKKIIVVLSLLILPVGAVIAAAELKAEKPTPIAVEQQKTNNFTSPVSNEFKDKAELYKLLYENSKSSNERLVSSIHLIIGTVITFLLALFGAQLLFNFKIKKEEIDIIKSDINEQITSLRGDAKNEINTLNNENNKALRNEVSIKSKQINDNLNIRFSDESKLNISIIEKQEQQIKFVKEALEYEIKRVEIQLEKIIGDVWDLRDVKANALSRYIKTAILELDNGHEVKHTLTDIVKSLSDEKSLHEHDKNELEKLSSLLPSKFESQKELINEKLNSLEIYKFIDDPLNPEKRVIKIISAATA